jgi:nucleoside-diphosphate-sugar epimerase
MSKKILITGGNGSIGRQISSYLSKKNEVYILDKVKLKKNKKINQFKVNLNNFNNVKKILDKILKDKKRY